MADDREKTLPQELREYIEAERRAAYARGYAAAKWEAFQVAKIPVMASQPLAIETQYPPRPENPSTEQSAYRGTELARGMPEFYVEEAYKAIAPQRARPVDISHNIERTRGIKIPHSSLNRAVHKLLERGILEQIGNTTAYRHAAGSQEEGSTE